jgi:N-acetylmuramoyl-L-alanine amidase
MGKVFLVFLDDGHGKDTPGKRTPYLKSLGRQVKENEFNKAVTIKIGEYLKRHGVHVIQVAPGDDDVPLKQRTDYANKIYWQYCAKYGKESVVAIYVSIHFNALDGTFGGSDPSGFSVHIYTGQRNKNSGKLAQYILDELKNGTKQINRGIVEQNLHVVRETVMPAVLTENGFMDNEREALLMISPDFQEEVATEHVKGICKYFGITYKEKRKDEAKVTNSNEPSTWAKESWEKAQKKKGKDGTPLMDGTNPKEPLTREMYAVIMDRKGELD